MGRVSAGVREGGVDDAGDGCGADCGSACPPWKATRRARRAPARPRPPIAVFFASLKTVRNIHAIMLR